MSSLLSSDAREQAAAPMFEPFLSTRLSLRNRVVMAPMTRRMAAEDGIATAEIVAYYQRRAAGGVGLIISEGTAIDGQHAYDTATVPRFETLEQVAAWKCVVEAVQAEGGAFAPQLWHTGLRAHDPIAPSPSEPSERKDGSTRPGAREMTEEDLDTVARRFADAARDAREIGCDSIELHGAHGYLLDSFLDAHTNRREDAWGGSFEKRMRYPLEVVRRVRAAVGPDYPIIYRFSQWSVLDLEQRKFRGPDDLAIWVRALRDAGVDILHVSTLNLTDAAFPEQGPRTLAGWTRELSGLPVIAVGSVSVGEGFTNWDKEGPMGVVDPAPAIELIRGGEADLIAVGRALIADPNWAHKVASGKWPELIPYSREMLQTLV